MCPRPPVTSSGRALETAVRTCRGRRAAAPPGGDRPESRASHIRPPARRRGEASSRRTDGLQALGERLKSSIPGLVGDAIGVAVRDAVRNLLGNGELPALAGGFRDDREPYRPRDEREAFRPAKRLRPA